MNKDKRRKEEWREEERSRPPIKTRKLAKHSSTTNGIPSISPPPEQSTSIDLTNKGW